MPSTQPDGAPDRARVSEESAALLQNENILSALKSFSATSPEMEIAAEFVNAHVQFVQDVVANDIQHNVLRSDIEIMDLTAHVNILLKQKDETIFKAMVNHSPSHYKAIQKNILKTPGDSR
jgi:hypothetical protein